MIESQGRYGIPTSSCLLVLLCRTATHSSCRDPRLFYPPGGVPIGVEFGMAFNIQAILLRSYDRFGRMIASRRSITLGRTVARSSNINSRSRSAVALAAISALSARCAAS